MTRLPDSGLEILSMLAFTGVFFVGLATTAWYTYEAAVYVTSPSGVNAVLGFLAANGPPFMLGMVVCAFLLESADRYDRRQYRQQEAD